MVTESNKHNSKQKTDTTDNSSLYGKLVCALTHNLDVCNTCKKCGPTAADARMNLIKKLASAFGRRVPWSTNTPSKENDK